LDKRKLLLIFIGLCGGMASGLLGIGGGIIFVPLLISIAKFDQKDAHATSVGAIVPAVIVGAAIYGLNKFGNLGESIYLGIGGIIGAQIGARLMYKIPNKQLKKGFGVILAIVAIRMIISWI
jgi:uncharacterized membrane protein YfcA